MHLYSWLAFVLTASCSLSGCELGRGSDAASRSKHNLAPGVRRYDIFNVRLQCATFSDSGLQYRVGELGGGGGGGETRVYRGPSLASLQGWQRRVDGSAWPQLLLLEAPGVLEVWFT